MNDRDLHNYAAFPREQIVVSIATVPISLNQAFHVIQPYAGLPPGKPGYALAGWLVENVQVFCTAVTATASVNPDISAINNLLTGAITPVAGTVVQGALVAQRLRIGALGQSIRTVITTNGTGTITNLVVTFTIRPFPVVGDAY